MRWPAAVVTAGTAHLKQKRARFGSSSSSTVVGGGGQQQADASREACKNVRGLYIYVQRSERGPLRLPPPEEDSVRFASETSWDASNTSSYLPGAYIHGFNAIYTYGFNAIYTYGFHADMRF